MSLFRQPLLMLSRSEAVKRLVSAVPVTADLVRRYVPGEEAADALDAVERLAADGLYVTIDHLGEDTADLDQASAAAEEYVALIGQLVERGLAGRAEVSIKLTALGLRLTTDVAPGGGHKVALEHARAICRAARNAGTTVTVDMEDHTVTGETLAVVRELRQDYPETGAVVQSYLYRTEADCQRLAGAGSRVRLCKGAYDEPEDVAYPDPTAVDLSYVRCLKTLLVGEGYPMIATHDPRLIEIATALVNGYAREQGSYEFQMLYGVRPVEQRRLAASGETVRVYLPYGTEWYGYLMRRLAERPRNLALFLSSLISQK